MCGIFGYIGEQNGAGKIVLNGLKRLEYRGYDSWGIGIKEQGEKFWLKKEAGKISKAKIKKLPPGNLAIGHTRWATHGGVTRVNAHPHSSCGSRIILVHNGIVENYQVLQRLLDKNHQIVSQTDTEIFAHLIEEHLKKYSLKEAVRRAFLKLKGLSAFLIADNQSDSLIAVKNGSPLIIGLGEGENIVSSDVNSLLSLTKKVIFLEDGQLAVVTQRKVNIFEVKTGRKIEPRIQKVNWKIEVAAKENYPHFMIKEISEQPRVLENILLNFEERIAKFVRLLDKYSRLYLVGCGSAHYAAMTGAYFLAKISQKEATAVIGSEIVYREPFLNKKDTLIVFFSQSGETIDIVEPIKRVQKKEIKTVALVNVFGSTLYRLADEKIWLEAGPEICVLSTKAFTAKLAVLGLAAYELAGKVNEGRRFLKSAIKEVNMIIKKNYQKKYLDSLVSYLRKREHVFVIGRGLSFPIALESALKIKEVSYIHAEGFAAGELKHGVIALIEKGTPCLVLAPDDETYENILSNAMEIKARGACIIGMAAKKEDIFDFWIPIHNCGAFTAIPQAVVAQLLGYKLGVIKGLDPDKPRNLAKSVTVK